VILQQAAVKYDQSNENQAREEIRRADSENWKRQRDIEMSSDRLILHSANGTRWAMSVSNAGATVWTAL
jgi:hypothetical protein